MALPQMEATGATNPAARPARRSPFGRLALGHVVMLVAGLLGALLTLAVLRRADDTVPVVVAAHDLVPGTSVSPASFRTADIRAGRGVLEGLFAPEEVDGLSGRVVTQRVVAGGLVRREDLGPPGDGDAPRAMSFALDRDRAVGGRIAAGDRIDVLEVDRRSGEAAWVIVDAGVLEVDGGGRSGPLGSDDRVTVTLAVDAEDAMRLAAALETGMVTLVRSTGAAAAEVSTAREGEQGPEREP